jgi:hypothetical protein
MRRACIPLFIVVAGSLAGCELAFPVAVKQEIASDSGTDAGDGVVDATAIEEGPPAADATQTFCATKTASLCWSFDDDPFYPSDKAKLTLQLKDGTGALTSTNPKTAPYAFAITLTGDPNAGDGTTAGMYHNQAADRDHVTCEFDMRVEVTAATDVYVLDFYGRNYAPVTGLGLTTSGSLVTIRLGTYRDPGNVRYFPIGTFEVNRWLHVTLDVDAANLSATGTVEGATATTPLDRALDWRMDAFFIGLGALGPPSTWRVAFDDIVCVGL